VGKRKEGSLLVGGVHKEAGRARRGGGGSKRLRKNREAIGKEGPSSHDTWSDKGVKGSKKKSKYEIRRGGT